MKKLAALWSSFPPEHKKRFYQGLGGYALVCAFVAAWIGLNAKDTVKDWQSRKPSASAVIRKLELPPQLIDPSSLSFERTVAVSDGRVYVAIIMSGLGLSTAITERALNELPKEATLAFSPYAAELRPWLQKAAGMERETLILMPMESATYPQEDPGPRAMSSRLSDKDNNDNLHWILNQGQGTIGVINFMGSRFLMDKKRLSPVFDTLRKNGSMFIETLAAEKSAARAIAGQAGLRYLAVDLKIDNDPTEKSIRQQLASLEKRAQERGYAIGIAEPYPLTITTLRSWSATLGKRGITLAPLATVWKNKPHDGKDPSIPEQAPE